MSTNQNGRFYCLKCSRYHNRSSTIGSFHHFGLDANQKGLTPEEVAVGIAFVKASEKRNQPRASVQEIKSTFRSLDFDTQFPDLDIEQQLRDWKEIGVIGDVRHSGKHWFEFLANTYVPTGADHSPKAFHEIMKQFTHEYDQSKKR